MLMMLFGSLVQQIMPNFVTQRSLYEARERPSKAYSWKAFMLCNIAVELPWQSLMALFTFIFWYYPIGMYHNAEAAGQTHERGMLMFLLVLAFFLFTSTFAHMVIAGIETAEVGSNLSNLLFVLCLLFCGVLATKEALPGFWIFMYRLSPFTYIIGTMLSTGVANTNVICSEIEVVKLLPPTNLTCGEFLTPFSKAFGGDIYNPDSTTECRYCALSSTNDFLKSVDIDYANRWRDLGIVWAYVVFNLVAALGIYWLARVPSERKKEEKAERK